MAAWCTEEVLKIIAVFVFEVAYKQRVNIAGEIFNKIFYTVHPYLFRVHRTGKTTGTNSRWIFGEQPVQNR